MKLTLLILLLILISGCTTGNVIVENKLVLEGPFNVTKVVDGDTLEIETGERVRFSGINTPETGECFYQEAKDKLKEIVLGKEVFLEKDITDQDKYKRKLRYVYLDEENLVNEILVSDGFAKVYDKNKVEC